MNAFNHLRTYPELDFKAVVRPNFDTLYSSAWRDITEGPVVVSVSDSGGRYYLLPTLSMWTDVVGSPGWRTTGTGAGNFVYVPPGWNGDLPAGLQPIYCTTKYLWTIGRIQTDGPDDYAAVNVFQDGLSVAPLSTWESGSFRTQVEPDLSVDQTPPLEQIEAMTTKDFFEYAVELMKLNPPNPADYSQVWRMRSVGIVAGESLGFASLDAETRAAFDRARTAAYAKMVARGKALGTPANGWSMLLGVIGAYGIQYLQRASVALAGLGANQLDDAYYALLIDDRGRPRIRSFFTSMPMRFRRRAPTGRSPSTTGRASRYPTNSTGERSPGGWISSTVMTVRSTFTSSLSRREPTRNRTGCHHRRRGVEPHPAALRTAPRDHRWNLETLALRE